MSDRYQRIYASQAERYDNLVSHEDVEGNLLKAIQAIVDLDGLDVVDFGAGTGRVTRQLLPLVRSIVACDISHHMLLTAQKRLGVSVPLVAADSRYMALKSSAFDLAIAGWTHSNLVGLHPEKWREEIDRVVAEMTRVTRAGGRVIIIETQGTGQTQPLPPSPYLAAYYSHLEETHGFQSSWIRTDYQFESVDQAYDLIGFFFGEELAARFDTVSLVPECTGIWWR